MYSYRRNGQHNSEVRPKLNKGCLIDFVGPIRQNKKKRFNTFQTMSVSEYVLGSRKGWIHDHHTKKLNPTTIFFQHLLVDFF